MNRNLVIITSFTFIGAFFGLFGCENDRNSDVICKNNPELCADLHRDSWCRFEKADLILHRLQLKNTESPSGKQLFQHLIYLENYSQCVELAAGVQHVLNTQRTSDRQRAYAVSTQNLSELQEFTKNNNDVYLAYYRWIRFNDQASLQIVIDQYKAGMIYDIDILAQLGAHYIRISPNEAKHIYRYLFDTVDTEQFNPDWLLAIASLYQQEQNFEYVYIFTKAYSLIGDEKLDSSQLLSLIGTNMSLATSLDSQASALIDDIRGNRFSNSESAVLLEDKKN
ncbi:DUF2989 domain-containing protein [Shewanella aestuarii]|uniref:DUF2989 domain-containing protein n=1 Tax=Shewanella aestuarii TaxID=1028752 RepID=A0A6G9QIU5_9GAMM|nr:DUF2989 domain-containing protein [Shewanella aestuarii]QIR14426.1 DUF2989 domain-containing protein [Shewanella aestuarii]